MKVIGLCGGSGSGKGTVAALLREYGIHSIDTDAVYHKLTSFSGQCLSELSDVFGSEIVKDGRLDRKKLRDIVFSEPNKEQKQMKLNSITHKFVLDEVRHQLAVNEVKGIPVTLVDAPMLFESGFNEECDGIIAVIADDNLRIARIMIRDGISFDDAKKRLSAQKSNEFLICNSTYVIYNNSGLDELRNAVGKIVEKIMK